MIRGRGDVGFCKGAQIAHLTGGIGQDAVKGQHGKRARERAPRRSTQRGAHKAPVQHRPAPRPPFIQVAQQYGLHRGPAAQVLTQRAHLNDPQRL